MCICYVPVKVRTKKRVSDVTNLYAEVPWSLAAHLLFCYLMSPRNESRWVVHFFKESFFTKNGSPRHQHKNKKKKFGGCRFSDDDDDDDDNDDVDDDFVVTKLYQITPIRTVINDKNFPRVKHISSPPYVLILLASFSSP